MKCVERKRFGSKIVKKFDEAKTPYQRIIKSDDISQEVKDILNRKYDELNPVVLRREIDRIKKKIFKKH